MNATGGLGASFCCCSSCCDDDSSSSYNKTAEDRVGLSFVLSFGGFS